MTQDEAIAIAEQERQRWAKGSNTPLYSPGGATQLNLWAAQRMAQMPLQSQTPAPMQPANSVIVLSVSGETLARATANSKDTRRKPGGR